MIFLLCDLLQSTILCWWLTSTLKEWNTFLQSARTLYSIIKHFSSILKASPCPLSPEALVRLHLYPEHVFLPWHSLCHFLWYIFVIIKIFKKHTSINNSVHIGLNLTLKLETCQLTSHLFSLCSDIDSPCTCLLLDSFIKCIVLLLRLPKGPVEHGRCESC